MQVISLLNKQQNKQFKQHEIHKDHNLMVNMQWKTQSTPTENHKPKQ